MDKYYNKGEVLNKYIIEKFLGEGRYGIAYLGVNDKGEKCVIKQLKIEELENTKKKLFYEEKILRSLDNYSSFPKFISRFEDEYREGYILEYMEGNTFHQILSKTQYEFTKDDIYEIANKLLDLIEELHNENIVHRDIRISNVIVNENKELLLIDFGLARFINNKRYTKKVDYWFFSDFLIHLYYSSYVDEDLEEEQPWYEELDLIEEERHFLKKLMGLDGEYKNIEEIRKDLEELKRINQVIK
ncbi:protein kinase domain-containing protein [Clostridium psychrophilum]|uniref:protein kinase domain-containing protein n=1 Tax=Clostridium psychrophilum TaxID=132926 RepID=UPI001C0D022D|nr:protein kinase family protein [Clostridium psychrophilum]MBU3182201.1 protein kinase family protein [Clostridium psychrophilum]